MIKLVTTLDCYLKGQLIDNIIPIDLITIANIYNNVNTDSITPIEPPTIADIYNIPTITTGDVENIFREVTT